MLDLITSCLNYMSLFFLEMYGDLSGEFLCRYWALEGEMLNVFIVMVLASLKSLSAL